MNSEDQFIPVLNQWIAVFMHRSMQNLNRFSKERGISMSQIFALTYVHHQGTCGVSDIGEGLGVSNAAASQLIDKLVHQNMIQRIEDPEDRRSKQISLTEKGIQLIKDSLIARYSWFHELKDTLKEDEKTQIINTLNLLIEKGRGLEFDKTTELLSHHPTK
jgi:DNA-binding MarR family transcriptional regulator